MSLFSVQARKHTTYYDNVLSAARTLARDPKDSIVCGKSDRTTSMESVYQDISRTSERSIQINKTYVVSALSKSGNGQQTPYRGRLTLQRRSRRKSRRDSTDKTTFVDSSQHRTPAPEKRLTLQRRTSRTPFSMDKSVHRGVSATTPRTASTVLSESNGRTTALFRSVSLRETANSTGKESGIRVETQIRLCTKPSSLSAAKQLEDNSQTFKTPTRKTPFEKIAAKRDVFERLAAKEAPKPLHVRTASIQRSKSQPQQNVVSKPVPAPRVNKVTNSVVSQSTTTSTQKKALAETSTPAPAPIKPEQPQSRPSEIVKPPDTLKMENSAVTVAVRVRPFNSREKEEKTSQVIFMKGQETVVHHPDTKQSYTFNYDFSFCSLDKSNSTFASQKMIYETLAKPLLQWAFEGFNTCLFAYGQTGSGKSYTMMGYGNEAGIIPRFCEDLFSQMTSITNEKVNVEMSYFEVYNEKIHDLLVTRDEPNQRRMPLRVREHPVHGPYVEELSANVVSSYHDIQGWLELGNKQRATAATGMNDKSSRSHSVFTLVMTQTKTELVEGEEHDHSITSKINLVDLAGSERCCSAKTSGDRLKEGASINKSLLTLGKVISALSEQALSRKKVFIPYRDSVLTWLLRESLGGNSKTAMVATVSPAGSNVEESLSTLRYAQQARTIINVAKVNEDTNAKLIRELKAEVEKLRAAQMSAQGVQPERVRQFQQEIVGLKNKLFQQEKEMAEANRAWREKLEEAEIRKREETKELQKAGVTFKVDNRLPNLVNLNEDPQLSEMLLYMIKEGQTTVGKLKSDSVQDIQLTGALIADQHCVITNMQGTVSIIPMHNAKTFVNGSLISESTVLHHGDRVILGGDHYFRFNHPAEVQSGKRVSCWTGAGDGHKDFEFAKNELLAAQRAQLEAEIEEAQLKAKEEMMQGIQMAKEVAQKELLDQKALYEDRIQNLEKELHAENERKRQQELDEKKVASQMQELQMAKLELEQEVDTQRKRLRLHMEAQAMEEHRVSQAKIVDALEAEKRKISKELEEMQKKRALRENQSDRNASPKWDAMKLSLMIEEANKISAKLRKNTVFSRHENSENDKPAEGSVLHVRVQNTKLGISTFWSLEKFQNNIAVMRELEQEDSSSKDEDVFYDPEDEWEQDISASSSTSSFSRRRSRSLLKSRRISGRLYEIRVHPIQSLHNDSSQTNGLMGVPKPPSMSSSSPDSALPGICKELIGQSVALFRSCNGTDESVADRLASDLYRVYTAVQTVSDLYDGLDDDSQENVFTNNPVAQTQVIKTAIAMESAVFVTMQWLAIAKPTSGLLYTIAEELKSQVKKIGGFFQLLIQGCESEITSMVTEAKRKTSQCLNAALLAICHLAAVTGMPLNTMALGAQATGKASVITSLLKGTSKGVHSLLEENLTITRDMLREAQLAYPRNPVLQSLKSKTLDLARSLQNYMLYQVTEIKEKDFEKLAEEASASHLQRLRTTVSQLYQLNQVTGQLNSALAAALRDKDTNIDLGRHRNLISSLAKRVDELITVLFENGGASADAVCNDLRSALQSLSTSWFQQAGEDSLTSSERSSESTASLKEYSTTHSSVRNRVYSKIVYSLPSEVASNDKPHWV